jgi:peptidoglycan L-alanyl-D-glutamate endopeptidase CwlK
MMDARAEKNLTGVHPDLIRVVRGCADACPVVFTITEGLRTKERQATLVASGASKTMNSRHLTGHAVDVAAMIDFDGDGDLDIRWDFQLYVTIATAMRDAAKKGSVIIRWGGCWQEINTLRSMNTAVSDYVAACKAKRTKPFIDSAHFELPQRLYPA